MKKPILVALLAALAAPTAAADEIQLTNGNKVVGVLRTDKRIPGKIVVDVGGGTIVFDAKEVESINPGRTPLHEYAERRAAVKDSGTVADYWALIEWCKENKVTRHVRELSEKIIALEPDHAGARKTLRHEKVNGRWLPYEEAQSAKGLIKYGNRWITAAERELIKQRQLLAAEKRRQRQEERKRKREEERERKLAAMQDYQDWLARESRLPYGYMYRPNWFWPAYYRPYPWTPYKYKLPPNGYQGGGGYGGAVPTFDLFRFVPNPFLK